MASWGSSSSSSCSSSYTVSDSTSSLGASLVATRALAAGDTIVEEPAAVWVRGSGPAGFYALADAVLAQPALAQQLVAQFGARVTEPQLDADETAARRRYLAAAVRRCPGVPVPAVLRVVASLNMTTPRTYGLYPALNFLNHSCAHNASVQYASVEPPVLRLVARRPIAAGEHITISYMGLSAGSGEEMQLNVLPRPLRQQQLAHLFGFQCACPECTGPD